MPRSEDSFSDYEALAEAEAEENVYCGLPREVLETMSNYSPSAGSMPSNVDLWKLYGITPPASPPSGLSSSFLMNEVNNQRAMVIQAQGDNELLCGQLMASEITNGELAYSISSISTAHVLVCLERDNLRRFRMVSIFIIMVLIIMVLIGIMFILLA